MITNAKVLFVSALFVSLTGCTAVKVKPVESLSGVKLTCIENCENTCFDNEIIGIVRDGFAQRGIKTRVYTGNIPSECEYYMTIYCERTWDLAMYMHHAELRLYKNDYQIGFAEYHLNGKGGFALTKFASTKSKITPLVDELLGGSSAIKTENRSE